MLRRDPCIQCGQPVFLAERLMVSSARLLYHRTCFRCARCKSQLTLANYYETEDGRFCCETCPDEEKETERAPLATVDESSSSEPSRPPSVAVDTNDLPRNDACERVNNVNIVESSETEDYAKDRTDQSLSLVQMRKKLFEKVPQDRKYDVFDSGQLHVSNARMSTEVPKTARISTQVPKTDEDKLSEVRSEVKPAEEREPSVEYLKSGKDDTVSLQSLESVGALSKAAEVEDVTLKPAEVEDATSKPAEVEDVTSKPAEVEDVTSKPAEVEDVTSKPAEVEDVTSKPVEMEDVTSKPVEMEDVTSKPAEVGDVTSKPAEVGDVTSKPAEVGDVTSKHAEVEDVSSKCILKDGSLESRMEMEDTISECRLKESGSLTSRDVTEPSLLKSEKDELLHSRVWDEPLEEESFPRAEKDEIPKSRSEDPEIKGPSIKISAASEDDIQPDDKLFKSTEDEAEVEPLVTEKEDEAHTRKEDDAEEKNDQEKEVKLPPSSFDTTRKPPVTPRKTSPLASPRKSSPVVTPRKTSPVLTPRVKSPPRPVSYPAELNPFSDDDEEEEEVSIPKDDSKEPSYESKDTSNPFGSDEEEEEVIMRQKERPPRPSKPPQRPFTHHGVSDTPKTTHVDTRRHIPAPANLNPFWEDGEEPEDEEEEKPNSAKASPQIPPVPKPRTVLSLAQDASPSQPSSPFSDRSNLTRSSGRFGSANSLSSIVSSASTMRRKKHAAPPPPVSSANSTLSPRATSFSPSTASVPSSPTLSSGRSTLGRSRKSRPAPKPPSASPITSNRSTWNPSTHYRPLTSDPPSLTTSTPKSEQIADDWQEGKFNKDEMNRSKQNRLSSGYTGDPEDPVEDGTYHAGDKSSHGQWKRKKGPAPPRPIPQRRQIRAIPLKELKRELDDIEVLQLELERQGVNLERTIRRKFDENPDASEASMTPDIEELVLQLFELVNEKNELFRKQAELMYLRRQQRLEEEHADLEYQIRVLMEQPERNKTDSDKAKEEKLIQRLVEVVERRNEIVECLEMDRLREVEEDQSIHSRLELFATKSLALNDAYISDLYKSTPALTCCALKEKKKKKDKTKKGTLRLHKKEKQVDADKDIDETEVEQTTKEKKAKRKWF